MNLKLNEVWSDMLMTFLGDFIASFKSFFKFFFGYWSEFSIDIYGIKIP